MKPSSFWVVWAAAAAVAAQGASLLPERPFAGSYGATSGAGAVLGWERESMGANPAAMAPPGWGLSAGGYSPFGLEELEVAEALIHRDGRFGGSSLAYRGARSQGVSASAWEFRQALRIREWSLGAGLRLREESGWATEVLRETETALGLLWRRHSFLGLGLVLQGDIREGNIRFAAGADAGWNFRGGMRFRLGAEAVREKRGLNGRLGAGWKLHEALSAYGGWDPAAATWSLGARFGLGRWEAFHALRRHAVLGSTSVQSLRWRRPAS